MIVVSDTTPLISLMKVSRLELLEKIFGEIIIPEAVFNELTDNPKFPAEAREIRDCHAIKVVRIEERKAVDVLQKTTGLDLGESEAIFYSNEKNADLLLMDEISGRKIAEQMNIKVIGTIGILQLSNSKGLLSKEEIVECINILKNSHRHISNALYAKILENIK